MAVPESSLILLYPAVTPEAAHPFGKRHIIIVIIFVLHVKVIQNIEGLFLNLAERNITQQGWLDETQDLPQKTKRNWCFQMVSDNGILKGERFTKQPLHHQAASGNVYL